MTSDFEGGQIAETREGSVLPSGIVEMNISRPDEEAAAAVIAEKKSHTEALVAAVSKEVEDRLRTRSAKFERILFVAVTLISLTGVVGVNQLVESAVGDTVDDHPRFEHLSSEIKSIVQDEFAPIREQLEGLHTSTNAVQDGMRAEFDERIGSIQASLSIADTYQQLRTLSLLAATEDENNPFRGDVETMVELAVRVAETPELAERRDFPSVMEPVILWLAETGNNTTIRQICDAAAERLARNTDVALLLTMQFGHMILAADEMSAKDAAYLDLFGDAAYEANYPEDVLPWRLAIELKNAGGEPTALSDAYVQELSRLPALEIFSCLMRIYYHLHPENWAGNPERPTLTHVRVGASLQAAVDHYEDEFAEMARDPGVGDRIQGATWATDMPPKLRDDLERLLAIAAQLNGV